MGSDRTTISGEEGHTNRAHRYALIAQWRRKCAVLIGIFRSGNYENGALAKCHVHGVYSRRTGVLLQRHVNCHETNVQFCKYCGGSISRCDLGGAVIADGGSSIENYLTIAVNDSIQKCLIIAKSDKNTKGDRESQRHKLRQFLCYGNFGCPPDTASIHFPPLWWGTKNPFALTQKSRWVALRRKGTGLQLPMLALTQCFGTTHFSV